MKSSTQPRDLTAWIQAGLLILLALMPFHAFLSIWLGQLVGFQAAWQSWKELVLIILGIMACVLAFQQPAMWQRLRTPFNYGLLAFIVVALLITAVQIGSPVTAIFGIKTDIEFLIAFFLAQLVADGPFIQKAIRTVVISSGIVIGFGLLQIFLLPIDFLAQFGYNSSTIQPYLPLDPAIDAVRITATLGGPNQLGSFLILPLCLVLWRLLRSPRWWHAIYVLGGLIVLWHTYARGAQVAMAAAIGLLFLLRTLRKWRMPLLLGLVVLAALALNLILQNISAHPKLQYYIFHQTTQETGVAASTDQHTAAIKDGLRIIKQHPLGQGLGSAGPASFRGDNPLIPESYYLQLAIETGIIGLMLFCAGQALLGWRLWHLSEEPKKSPWRQQGAAAAVATLAGIAILNLVLHGWADSSTALIFWSFTGAVVGSKA